MVLPRPVYGAAGEVNRADLRPLPDSPADSSARPARPDPIAAAAARSHYAALSSAGASSKEADAADVWYGPHRQVRLC